MKLKRANELVSALGLRFAVCSVLCAGTASSVFAQTWGSFRNLRVTQVGLSGSDYINAQGVIRTELFNTTSNNWIAGASTRFAGLSATGTDGFVTNGFQTTRVGTLNFARNYTKGILVNEAGFVAGQTFAGDSTLDTVARDAWTYAGSQTRQLGFTGAGYEQSNGFRSSQVTGLSLGGRVSGFSKRLSTDGTDRGQDAWYWNGFALQQVGLTGAGYTSPTGSAFTRIGEINDAGLVTGESYRIDAAGLTRGIDAWVFDGTTTIPVGLRGSAYESAEGLSFSFVQDVKDSGAVVGNTFRTAPGNSNFSFRGSDAWIAQNGVTRQVGLTGGIFESASGFRFTGAAVNRAGVVWGQSNRYLSDGTQIGTSGWVLQGNTTVEVGLLDGLHTGTNGARFSLIHSVSPGGRAIGVSSLYAGSALNGREAWFFDGTTSTRISLEGTEYTGSSGFRFAEVDILVGERWAFGSNRKIRNVNTGFATTTWVYDGSSTQVIGLYSAPYTSVSGLNFNDILFANAIGQAVGYATLGGQTTGLQSSWYFDPFSRQTFAITPSGYSLVKALTSDGIAIGEYIAPGAASRIFAYRPDLGFTDISQLIISNPDGAVLREIFKAYDLRAITAYDAALQPSSSRRAFVLNNLIPAPSAIGLMGLGGLVCVRRKRASIQR